MRRNIKYKVLEMLLEGALDYTDVIIGTFSADYGASRRMMQKKTEEVRRKRLDFFSNLSKAEIRKQKRSLSEVISRLRKDGLVNKRGDKWFITGKGRISLSKTLPKRDYPENRTGNLKIIAFDIREKERSKRRWLNRILKDLNFNMLQKSVWVGNVNLPEEFISDLKRLNILDCVDIFEVNKKGTLSEIL